MLSDYFYEPKLHDENNDTIKDMRLTKGFPPTKRQR